MTTKHISKITLGTVQLGMDYGIANTLGQPDETTSRAMLSTAIRNRITSLDTARAYGTSEKVLGSFLKNTPHKNALFITSKLIIDLPRTASKSEIEKVMVQSVEASLENLCIDKLDCLMLHRAEEATRYGRFVPEILEKMIAKGYTDSAGISVYFPYDLDAVLENDVFTATQVPMNLFDQKLIHSGYLENLRNKNITVFVRSVFLQGLFFLNPDKMTDPLLVKYAKPFLEKLRALCKAENMSIAEFAISFIRDLPGVTSLVLGADTEEQILQNICYLNSPQLSDRVREECYTIFKDVNVSKIMEVLSKPKNKERC